MSDVFISYSKTDRHQAEALADDLKLHGYSVWWDTDLYGGEDFHDVILQAINDAKAAIVIWSESSVKSQWVRGEAQHAQSQQKLIPTKFSKLRDADIPLNFRPLHTEPLEDRERVLRAVERLTGRRSQASIAERAGKPIVTTSPARTETSGPQPERAVPVSAIRDLSLIAMGFGALAGFLVGLFIIMLQLQRPLAEALSVFVGPGGHGPGYIIAGAIGGLVGGWARWLVGGVGKQPDQASKALLSGSIVGAIIVLVLAKLGGLILPITHLFWNVVNRLLA